MVNTEELDKSIEANTGISQKPIDSAFYTDLVMPHDKPLGFAPIKIPELAPQEKPTFTETAGANFRLYNAPYRALNWLTETITSNPFGERTMREDGYNPIKEGLLDDIPEEYWARVLSYGNREDATRSKERILQEIQDKEIASNSGGIANVVTTLGATFLDPTILIPIAQTAKYASISKGMLQGMIRTGGSMAPVIALQNAILTGTKETEGITEWAWNTMFESAVAAGIGGAVGAYAAKGAKNELNNMKAVFKAIEDDVEIKYLINDKGEIVKPIASAINGVGAAQAKGVQDLLDAGEVSFKSNPYVKKIFALGSPAIKGATDRFEVTRRLTSQLMPHPFETSLGKAHAIQDPSAFDFVKHWRHVHANAEIFTRAMWLDSLGLEGLGKGIKAVSGTWTGKYQTLEEFREACGMAYRRGGEGASPQVKAVVELYNKEIYKPLWEEMQKRYPDMQGHEFTNIVQYLNRAYHKGKIQERPDEFIKDVAAYITDVNKRVEARRQPINQAKESVNQIRETLNIAKSKLKPVAPENVAELQTRLAEIDKDLAGLQPTTLLEGATEYDIAAHKTAEQMRIKLVESLQREREKVVTPLNATQVTLDQRIAINQDIRRLNADLAAQKKLAKDLEAQLNQDIVNGKIELDMLEGKPQLTSGDIEQLEQINAPVVEAEKELKTAQKEAAKIGTLKHFEHVKKKGKETAKLEEIVNQTAEDFRAHGREAALTNITRSRNKLIQQRDKLKTDLLQSESEASRLKQTRETETERLAKEKVDPILLKIEKGKQQVAKIEEEIANIQKKIDKTTNESRKQKLVDQDLFRAKLRRDTAKNDVLDLRDKLKAVKAQLKSQPISAAEESLNAETKLLEKELKDITESLGASRKTYRNVKNLLRHEDITIQDFQDLLKTARRGSEKVQKGVKEAEVISFKEAKAKAKERIKTAEQRLEAARNKILEDIEAGTIPEHLYYKGAHTTELLNPKEIPSLRSVLDEHQIQDVAESVRNNIMQLNEEQVLGQMFGSATSGGNNPFKSRVLMWNDEWAEKWLVNDIDQLAGLFTDQVSKRLYLDDVLQKYGSNWQEGMEGVVKKLTYERDIMESQILEKPASAERTKELNKLKNDFENSEKFIGDMYKIYMGNYVNKTTGAYRVTDGIKKFAVATLLGNVPIVQIPEFFSPLFRYTFDEYIYDGLVSTMKRMKFIATNSSDKAYIRGAFTDLGQGINVATGARTQALMGYGSQYQPKTLLERYVNNMANWSQNVSLANHIMDFQETMVSFSSQSSLLRVLEKYKSGEQLSKIEIAKLDRARLNPKEWADRILKQYGVNKTEEGAFVANFHLWEDAEAARRFRIAIEKEVRQVIMKTGPMDVPFAFKDPILSMMTQFTSYMFAATNNFTVPLLTSPDLTKLTGTFLMLAAGAAVDPIRQLAKGEDPDLSFGALANAAIYNGGIMGWQTDILMKANANLDLPPLRFLQSDRVKSQAGLFGAGPGLGMADMMMSVIGSTLSGEMNEKDARKAMRLFVPFSGTWYARRPLDTMLKSFNLPKNRAQAKKRKEWE